MLCLVAAEYLQTSVLGKFQDLNIYLSQICEFIGLFGIWNYSVQIHTFSQVCHQILCLLTTVCKFQCFGHTDATRTIGIQYSFKSQTCTDQQDNLKMTSGSVNK